MMATETIIILLLALWCAILIGWILLLDERLHQLEGYVKRIEREKRLAAGRGGAGK
jgi:uncharacterized membrane protein YqgA involved in biofilm formation